MQSTKSTILNCQQVAQVWDSIADTYSLVDPCMQTSFYALSNILQLDKAKNILEIACGTGKLLPYALGIKGEESNYFASDISPEMVELSQKYLLQYIRRIGVEQDFQTWLKLQRLQLFVQNGEEPLPNGMKFDRIIVNLALQITENPEKMLENLHNHAQAGCLLGIAIPGNPLLATFFPPPPQLVSEFKSQGLSIVEGRSYYYLHKKVAELAEKTGWEVVLQWEQNATFGFYQVEESLQRVMREMLKVKGDGLQLMTKKVNRIFEEKKNLNFPTELYLLRKK